jgi:hypothetical protein
MDYENNMRMTLKNTIILELESSASNVSKIIWFRNTCILLIAITGCIRMIPASGECEDTLTPFI